MADKKPSRFDYETTKKINGLSLVFSFIVLGLFLQFYPQFFGSETATTIVKCIFIGIGILSLIGEGYNAQSEYSGTRDTSVRAFGNQHSGK